MKKIALLLVAVLSVTLLFAACTPNYTWEDAEKDIARIEDLGFVVYMENNEENVRDVTKSINDQLSSEGKKFTVEIVNLCNLANENYDIISFKEFKTEEQAKAMYDNYIASGSAQKVVLFGTILINSNAQEAIELLGYDFK